MGLGAALGRGAALALRGLHWSRGTVGLGRALGPGATGHTGGDTPWGSTPGPGGGSRIPGGTPGRGTPWRRLGKGRIGHGEARGTPGPEGGWSKGGTHWDSGRGDGVMWQDVGRGRCWQGLSAPGTRGAAREKSLLGSGDCHLDCLPWSVPSVTYCHQQLLPCPVSPLPPAPRPVPCTRKPLGLSLRHPPATAGCSQGVPRVHHCLGIN